MGRFSSDLKVRQPSSDSLAGSSPIDHTHLLEEKSLAVTGVGGTERDMASGLSGPDRTSAGGRSSTGVIATFVLADPDHLDSPVKRSAVRKDQRRRRVHVQPMRRRTLL